MTECSKSKEDWLMNSINTKGKVTDMWKKIFEISRRKTEKREEW